MNNIKRIISLGLVVGLIGSVVPVPVHANELIIDGEGDKVLTSDSKEVFYNKLKKEGFNLEQEIKPSVDITEGEYKYCFPEVVRQVDGTCAAFSTVYYQFSYAANKINGVKSAEEAKQYSPYYIHSFVTSKEKDNTYTWVMHNGLKERGSVLKTEFDLSEGEECLPCYSTDVPAMRNALKTRVEHYCEYWEEYETEKEYSISDKLTMAKKLLSNDIILVSGYGSGVVSTHFFRDKVTKEDYEVVYRMGDGYDHAVAIVGYDDEFWCDVNYNHIKEEGEVGAFKVVNSWGKDKHVDGYFWVLYDAIVNKESALPASGEPYPLEEVTLKKKKVNGVEEYYLYIGNGEQKEEIKASDYTLEQFLEMVPCIPQIDGVYSNGKFREVVKSIYGEKVFNKIVQDTRTRFDVWYDDNRSKWSSILEKTVIENRCLPSNWDEILSRATGCRTRMFSYGEATYFGFINVKKYDVSIVGQVDYQMDNRSDYALEFARTDAVNSIKPTPRGSDGSSIEASEVFDLSEFVRSQRLLIGEQHWQMSVTIGKNNSSDYFNFSLTDDKGNVIPAVSSNTGNKWETLQDGAKKKNIILTTNLKMADVNYDGRFTREDIEIFKNSINGTLDYSVLQKRLMDLDQNGIYDEKDVHKMLDILHQALFVMNDNTFVQDIQKEEFDGILSEFGYIQKGDLNGDHIINSADLDLLQELISGEKKNLDNRPNAYADMNGDGQWTHDDYRLLGSKIGYKDLNQDGKYNDDDIFVIWDQLIGYDAMTQWQKNNADLDMNGKIDFEDLYLLMYGYYVNAGSNPGLDYELFFGGLMPTLNMSLGDLNYNGGIDTSDLELIRATISGHPASYRYLFLGDVNKDGWINEADEEMMIDLIGYKDIDGDGRYTIEDLWDVLDHLTGLWTMPAREKVRADANGNGIIDSEDLYILAYGYYKNSETNPDCNKEKFYAEVFPMLAIRDIGDINGDGKYDEMDLRILKETIAGKPSSYLFLIVGDINQDLKVDEQDLEIYTTKYMSDIPFTYTLDTNAKTMTITGVKDKNAEFLDIAPSYCVNGQTYSVTALGRQAFTECKNVMTIYIPETVTSIPADKYVDSPFYGMDSSLTKINCASASKPSGFGRGWNAGIVYEFGYEMKNAADYFTFVADDTNKTLTLTGLKGTWHYKGDIAYIDEHYLVNGEHYTVTKIADDAFYNTWCCCDTVYLPATLEEIGSRAFEYNSGMEYVDLARCRKLKKIGSRAFANNHYLEGLYIPASVTTIEANTPEDSIVWNCVLSRIYILVETSETEKTWGKYWNYIDAENIAETDYFP